MQGTTSCHTALESPPACDAPRPTPWHASRAASHPMRCMCVHTTRHQRHRLAGKLARRRRLQRESHRRSASLLLTPAARAKPVPTRLRAGHRASASTDHDDKISLEAAERLRAGARGSRELLRCRCSLLGPPAPCLRRGSSEDVTARRRWSTAPPQPQPAAPAPALATSEAVASVRLNREISAMKIE